MISFKWIALAVVAITLRAAAFYNGFDTTFQNKIDFVTPVTSYKRLTEGLYLAEQLGLSPYSGSVFAQPPLVLLPFLLPKVILQRLLSVLPAHEALFASLMDALPKTMYILCDMIIAWALCGITRYAIAIRRKRATKIVDEVSPIEPYLPYITAAIYLLNPIMIVSCVSMSTVIFHNLAIALAFNAALSGNLITSTFFTAAAAYMSIAPALLLAPVIVMLSQSSSVSQTFNTRIAVKAVLAFAGWLAVLLYSSYVVTGRSWEFINAAYMFRITASDLTPNWGNTWYFFTEVFEDFRPFFLYVFNAHIIAYLVPLTIYFRTDGVLLGTIFTAIISIFNFYPALGDTFFYFTLLINHFYLARYMRYGFVIALLIMFSLVLGPVFFWAWVQQGTGNANFFYFITLLFCIAQILLVVEFMYAYRRYYYSTVKPAKATVSDTAAAAAASTSQSKSKKE